MVESAMTRRDVLLATRFGERIAEEEGTELNAYFVETDPWRRIYGGEVDVVYGMKGAGKSAIYSLLLSRSEALRQRGILIVAAENPRGVPIFRDLTAEPPPGENEFRGIWKLYFLSLIAQQLRAQNVAPELARKVIEPLESAGLLEKTASLRTMLRSAVDYARNLFRVEGIEGGVKMDPVSGLPNGIIGQIVLREPDAALRNRGHLSADRLFEMAEEALAQSGLTVWLALDRLDVAFADSDELEGNALRALFRVYLDLLQYRHISLKIFLRSDIWQRILATGFREASHVTRHLTISWSHPALLNLVVRRALHNDALRAFYQVNEAEALADFQKQTKLFYRIFPDQVESGPKRPKTFDWMLSRTRDAFDQNAPRELIHLLTSAKNEELQRLELGYAEPPKEALFTRNSLNDALPEVSRVRYEQTLCAEFPALRPWFQKLEGERTEQTPDTLAAIWNVSRDTALERADQLCEVGFFEKQGSRDDLSFRVPFLYRPALKMVQGSAE